MKKRKRYKNNKKKILDRILFADNQIANTEDNLQIAVHQLDRKAREYNCEIFTSKMKVMAFREKYPIPSKIIKQKNRTNSNFQILRILTYQKEIDIYQKLISFQRMWHHPKIKEQDQKRYIINVLQNNGSSHAIWKRSLSNRKEEHKQNTSCRNEVLKSS